MMSQNFQNKSFAQHCNVIFCITIGWGRATKDNLMTERINDYFIFVDEKIKKLKPLFCEMNKIGYMKGNALEKVLELMVAMTKIDARLRKLQPKTQT